MEHTPRQKRRTALAAVVLAAALPFTLVACSSGTGAHSDAASDGSSSSQGVGAKWGACMRDAGFDLQDPADAMIAQGTYAMPPGADPEQFNEAAQGCLGEAGVEPASSSESERWAREYRKAESCIREHGFEDYPEQPEGAIGAGDYARAQEPGFKKTFDECLRKYSPDTKTLPNG